MDIVRLSTVYIHIIKWNDYSALIEKIISQSCSRQTVRYLYSVTLGRTLTDWRRSSNSVQRFTRAVLETLTGFNSDLLKLHIDKVFGLIEISFWAFVE